MVSRGYVFKVVLVVFLGLTPYNALAYGMDVHFNLTYVLCRLAGLPANDALWIADADESMDENECTTAFSDKGDAIKQLRGQKEMVWPRNGINWHAFTDEGADSGMLNDRTHTMTYGDPAAARKAVNIRRDFLWNTMLNNAIREVGTERDSFIKADIAMGQCLHFEQDYFAHRQMTGYLDDKTWLPYGSFLGHALIGNGHTPDYVAARPELAYLMVEDCYERISNYAQNIYKKPPDSRVDKTKLHALINALIAVYPKHLNVKTDTVLGFDDIPDQITTNKALSSALADIGYFKILGSDLPRFTYPLPYDKPKTLLSEVKNKLNSN